MGFYDMNFMEMLTRMTDLERIINRELQYDQENTAGWLTAYRRNNRQNYFQTEKKNGKRIRHGITRDSDTIKALCRKAYAERMLERIEANRNCLLSAQKKFQRLDFQEIVHSLPQVYQTVPEDYFRLAGPGDVVRVQQEKETALEKEIREWAEAEYEMSTYRPEDRTNITSRGERMRSKGEVGIAEKLYQFDVPFRYEEVLHIGGREFALDFKPRRRRDGKIYYWEHCGMPFDKKYMERHKWKLQQYETVGIVPWDNLIVTYNDADGNLDMRIIESEIRNKLL